jgi:hypothetical protein
MSDVSNNDTDTLNRFNTMITKANEILGIGGSEALENEQNTNNLRQLYLEAINNYIKGPEQIEQTFKNYYVYENGELAYNQEQENLLLKRANIITNNYLTNFKENIANSVSLLESYSSLLINYQNVQDYLNNFTKENPILEKKLKNKNADILTNDRKSYYEDQQIDTLYNYHKILLYIYIFILIAFLICMIFKSSNFSRAKQIAIFVFMILYIFIAVPVFHFILRICKNILELLPANVYQTL